MTLPPPRLLELKRLNNGVIDSNIFPFIEPLPLKGDGDFRSEECIEFLKQSDIVCTNPPFSLFRQYIAQLMEFDKKFLVIGSKNAITYKEIFPLIRDNKLWLGHGFANGNAFFAINRKHKDDYASGVYDPDKGLVKFRNVNWYTNLDHNKRHEELPLYKKYSPEEYPKYDNYDAIEVSKTGEIPEDYDGVMGVPITFLDKYCPEQFEIIGSFNNSNINDKEIEGYVPSKDTPTIVNGKESLWNGPVVNKTPLYKRICIRRKA